MNDETPAKSLQDYIKSNKRDWKWSGETALHRIDDRRMAKLVPDGDLDGLYGFELHIIHRESGLLDVERFPFVWKLALKVTVKGVERTLEPEHLKQICWRDDWAVQQWLLDSHEATLVEITGFEDYVQAIDAYIDCWK